MLLIATMRGILKSQVSKLNGELVSSWGRSAIASFESPVSALECCMNVDKQLTKINAQRSAHQQVYLSGGVEHGEYIRVGNDLFGPTWDMCCALGAAAAEDSSTLLDLHVAGNEGVAHCSSC